MSEDSRKVSPRRHTAASDYDVVIAGAGVAGALAALLIGRRGHRVLLAERQKFPRSKVCGCCLNGRAQAVLSHAGLSDGLQRLNPIRTSSLRIHRIRKTLTLAMPDGLAISRQLLDSWLVNEARSVGVEFVEEVSASVLPIVTRDTPHSSGAEAEFREVKLVRTQARVPPASGQSEPTVVTDERETVRARMVLACDGLAHPSLNHLPEFESVPRPGARIGLGATCRRADEDTWIPSDQIQMIVGDVGYVGVVEVEGGWLNLAAAVDPGAIGAHASPRDILIHLFASAGVPAPINLASASVRGTVPLTRKSKRMSSHRIFLLGDATGYVEPFTGEGMAWALTASMLADPIVDRILTHGWSSQSELEYTRMFHRAIAEEQGLCRLMAALVKRPALLKLAMSSFRCFPWAARFLIDRVNRLPRILQPKI